MDKIGGERNTGMDTSFNLQKFLADAHAENKSTLKDLQSSVNDGFDEIRERASLLAENLAKHERHDIIVEERFDARLKNIEGVMKNAKWFFRAGIVAIIGFIIDIIRYHSGAVKP